MKLVLASDNKNKLREFRTLFENFGVELISKAESGFTEEVEETGETFAENMPIPTPTAITSCFGISAGEMTARRGLPARSAVLSRTATYLPPRGRARERSFLRPAARTASAMIRFSARTDLTAPWRS